MLTVSHNCLTGATFRPNARSIRISDFVVVKIAWNRPHQLSNCYILFEHYCSHNWAILRFKTTFHNKATSPSVLPSSRLKKTQISTLQRATPLCSQVARKRAQRAPLGLKRYTCRRGSAALTLPAGPLQLQNTSYCYSPPLSMSYQHPPPLNRNNLIIIAFMRVHNKV